MRNFIQIALITNCNQYVLVKEQIEGILFQTFYGPKFPILFGDIKGLSLGKYTHFRRQNIQKYT